MMLFKLSLKNIKNSFKNYAIYFFTLILGVAIFYVFNSIESQTVMMNVSKSTYKIIDLMTSVLSGVSVFVSIILGCLIIYASRFLIKRRNKEFGIYLTLGMSKRKISMILFFETLFIGILSLEVGLVLGTILSQFMSLLVANMFDANMTNFKFIFSTSACIKTLCYFGIMYLLVMIFNTFNVSKCKLIDLLQSNKKSEKIKLKNPILCTIIFIISTVVLGYAYYLVTGGIEKLKEATDILIPIAMGAVSTFFIFWSLSGLLLNIFMSIKKVYYKGLNSFTLRQISSKINTTVLSMSVISLMLFVTICLLSSCLSLKESMSKNINDLTPVDIELTKIAYNENTVSNIDEIIKDSKLIIQETLANNNINIDDYLKDVTSVKDYVDRNFTAKDSLGSSYNKIKTKYPYLILDTPEKIMTISDYNNVAKLYGNKTYSLNKDEFIVVSDYDAGTEIRNEGLKNREQVTINNHKLKPKYDKCVTGFIDIAANHINNGIIVVPDDVVDEQLINHYVLLANYKETSKDKKYEVDEMFDNFSRKNHYVTTVNTKLDIIDASVGLGALATFIGLYLGIIFLISSAAILALKELSESTDNKERFSMLRKLGADEKMINKALFTQIAIFFAFPLVLAIIHSIFGLKFAMYILQTFGTEGLLPSILLTTIFLTLIYGGYFIITYICSKNIIKEN